MKNTIIVLLLSFAVSGCSTSSKTQVFNRELLKLNVIKADLAKYRIEDSLARISNPPYSPSTRIVFTQPVQDSAIVTLYDIQGSPVSYTYAAILDRGDYQVIFNAIGLESGLYFVHCKLGNVIANKKFMLVK